MPISSLPPSKKRKIGHVDEQNSKIQQLETELGAAITQNSSLNALIGLLRIPQTSTDPQLCSKAIYALYRIFVSLITSGRLALKGDESAKVVRAWIWERLNAYTDLLVSFLSDEEKSLRVSSSIS
jgi:U3 small nucleolar RNA-associated protein 19